MATSDYSHDKFLSLSIVYKAPFDFGTCLFLHPHFLPVPTCSS